jgi:hypothetical protein
MDVLKVVLDFVARSEWPLVAIGGIYLLRETLGRVAAGIISGKFEGWGFKGEFERKTELAELLLTPVDATPRTVPGPREPPALDTAGTLWNQLSPTGFVITAGNALRRQVSDLARHLTADEKAAWEQLREVRDSVADGAGVTAAEATSYQRAAARLSASLARTPPDLP